MEEENKTTSFSTEDQSQSAEEIGKEKGATTIIQVPEVSDLINCAKFQATFQVPGRLQTHTIQVSLLWEGEYKKLILDSAKITHPLDMEGRGVWLKTEELVWVIDRIDDTQYFDKEDSENHKLLKVQLRMELERFDPAVLQIIKDRVKALNLHRDMHVGKLDEELKKKFDSEVFDLKPQ